MRLKSFSYRRIERLGAKKITHDYFIKKGRNKTLPKMFGIRSSALSANSPGIYHAGMLPENLPSVRTNLRNL
jgi:hypothetical protein